MTPLDYCADKAARRGSSLHYALYFADRRQRPALQAVHAFYRELMEIPRRVSEPSVARAKLDWWRTELERAFAGQGQHPVSQALQQYVLARPELPREALTQIVEGAAMDLEYGAYPSFRQLSLYCHRTGGALSQLTVEICGYSQPETARAAHDLGMGFQLLSLLRRLRDELAFGRLYIPEDELSKAGVSEADLRRTPSSEAVRALLAEQAERGETFLTQGLNQIAPADRSRQRCSIILAELYQTLYAELRAEGFPMLERRTHLTPIRKLWRAWRTARRLGTTPTTH